MHEVQQINAYICATWRNMKHTTMIIFGKTIKVSDKLITETSEDKCQIIYKTKKCTFALFFFINSKNERRTYVFNSTPPFLPFFPALSTI